MKRFAGLVICLGVLLAGCGSGNDADREPGDYSDSGTDDTSKYDQTWPKDYSATTCGDWSGEMTDAQQFAAAADMLTGARNKGDGGTGVAPDALITDFQGGITTACVLDEQTIDETAVGLYLTERERFRP